MLFTFVGFLLVISIVRMMRRIRRLREEREHRMMAEYEATHRRPSDDMHDRVWLPLCERVARAAGERLGRALTPKERRAIWRSRTVMVLEIALREVEGATSAEGVVELLGGLPQGVDRPDPTKWCAGASAGVGT